MKPRKYKMPIFLKKGAEFDGIDDYVKIGGKAMKPLRESEIRQRKMLSERLANRKSSLPSADSDLMAANDDISYGRLREQESFDQDRQPTNATCKNCKKLKEQIRELKNKIKCLKEKP